MPWQSSPGKLRSLAPNVTAEALIDRFGRRKGQAPRLREGLRLALKSEGPPLVKRLNSKHEPKP